MPRDLQDERLTRGRRVVRQHGDAHSLLEMHSDQHIADQEIPKHQIRAGHAIARFPSKALLQDVRALAQADAIPVCADPGTQVTIGTAIRADLTAQASTAANQASPIAYKSSSLIASPSGTPLAAPNE